MIAVHLGSVDMASSIFGAMWGYVTFKHVSVFDSPDRAFDGAILTPTLLAAFSAILLYKFWMSSRSLPECMPGHTKVVPVATHLCKIHPSVLTQLQKQPIADNGPIHQLYAELRKVFDAEKQLGYGPINKDQPIETTNRLSAKVINLCKQYASQSNDWKMFSHFNDLHYVRNLVDANEDFELMVICWRPGQASRVHNHANSHCWLTVLQGDMSEVQYSSEVTELVRSHSGSFSAPKPAIPGVISAEGPCPPLMELDTNHLSAGQSAYINDDIALHAVRCPATCPGEGGVTLHLYSPPIRRVTLFEPDEGRVVLRTPGFYTIKGVLQHS